MRNYRLGSVSLLSWDQPNCLIPLGDRLAIGFAFFDELVFVPNRELSDRGFPFPPSRRVSHLVPWRDDCVRQDNRFLDRGHLLGQYGDG